MLFCAAHPDVTNKHYYRKTGQECMSLLYCPAILLYKYTNDNNNAFSLRWMIPPIVVHPEKIDFRRFV